MSTEPQAETSRRRTRYTHDRPRIEVAHGHLDRWHVNFDGDRVGPEMSRDETRAVVAWLEHAWNTIVTDVVSHLEEK